MGKRRTRKEKEKAQHNLTLSWAPQGPVKGQKESKLKSQIANPKSRENARISGNVEEFEPVRRDLVKSLVLASLILGSEIVIYLVWNKF